MALTREQALQAITHAERGDLKSMGEVLRSLVNQDTVSQTVQMTMTVGTANVPRSNVYMPNAGTVTMIHLVNNKSATVFSSAENITFRNVSRSANVVVLAIGSGLGTQGHVFSAAPTGNAVFTAGSWMNVQTDGGSGLDKNVTIVAHMDRAPPSYG